VVFHPMSPFHSHMQKARESKSQAKQEIVGRPVPAAKRERALCAHLPPLHLPKCRCITRRRAATARLNLYNDDVALLHSWEEMNGSPATLLLLSALQYLLLSVNLKRSAAMTTKRTFALSADGATTQ
jgi:hypothetical protein